MVKGNDEDDEETDKKELEEGNEKKEIIFIIYTQKGSQDGKDEEIVKDIKDPSKKEGLKVDGTLRLLSV